MADTYRVTWVDITVVFDSDGFLLHSRVVLVMTVHSLRDKHVPDGANTFIELRVECQGV